MGKFKKHKYLILIILIGLLARIIKIDQSLWLDEAIGALAVKKFTYMGLINDFMPIDNHSPLYYLLLKFSTSLFGYSELGIRMLGVTSSLLSIFLTYKLTLVLSKNKNLSLFSALILSTSQFNIYYSQEARMYSITPLFCVASVYFLTKFIEKPNINSWLGISVSTSCLIFSDYVPIFFLPVYFFYPLFFKIKNIKKFYLTFITAFIPLLTLSAFWYPIFAKQLINGRLFLTILPEWKSIAGGASLKNLSQVWTKFTGGRITFESKKLYLLYTIIISSIYIPILFKSFSKAKKVIFLIICPVILTYLVSIFFPAFIYFRFSYLYPLFAIVLAYGLFEVKNELSNLVFIVFIFANLLSLGIYYFDANQQREDWRSAISFVEEEHKPQSIVLFAFSDTPAPYQWYEKRLLSGFGGTDSISANEEATKKKTKELVKDSKVVYFFEYLRDLSDPSHIVENTLSEEGFIMVKSYSQFKGGVGQIYQWERI